MTSTQQKLQQDIADLAEVVDEVVMQFNQLKAVVDAAKDPANAGTNTADVGTDSLEDSIAKLREKILGITETTPVAADGDSSASEGDGAHFGEDVTGSEGTTITGEGEADGTVDLGTSSTTTPGGLPDELSEGTTPDSAVVDHEQQDETTSPTA